MQLEGSVNINAPRDKVFKFLTNADFVAQCAPGVKSMEVVVPNEKYRAVASVGFGSVITEFKTDVEFLEIKENERAKVKAHGNAPGSVVDATSEMVLSDGEENSTDLHWTADVAVMGSIASLAARLLAPITQKLTAAFFDCVKTKIEE